MPGPRRTHRVGNARIWLPRTGFLVLAIVTVVSAVLVPVLRAA